MSLFISTPVNQPTAVRLMREAGLVVERIAGSEIMFSGGTEAEALAALAALATVAAQDDLIQARMDASAAVLAMIAPLYKLVTASYPQPEMDAWPAKVIAAQAHLDGTPQQMLIDEAAITGETANDVAQLVLTKSAQYLSVVAQLTGLRRKALADVGAATDVAGVEAAMTTAQTTAVALQHAIETILGAPGV